VQTQRFVTHCSKVLLLHDQVGIGIRPKRVQLFAQTSQHSRMPPELIQCPGEGNGRRLMTGKQDSDELVTNFIITQSRSIIKSGRNEQLQKGLPLASETAALLAPLYELRKLVFSPLEAHPR
jgi:hypothetical protein